MQSYQVFSLTLGKNAMTEERPVIRQQSDERSQIIVFVKHMHSYLQKITGKNLDAATARIANVTFSCTLDNREVRKIIKRTP